MASTKVGDGLLYQAALRWVMGRRFCNAWATRVVQEKRPSSMGVVRAMAKSDHWRWVSPRPDGPAPPERWPPVASAGQTFQDLGRVRRRVGTEQGLGAKAPWRSRINTQRMSTGGLPERYQVAVCEVSSTVRVVPSYQATAALAHVTWGWSRSVCSRGHRGPFSGERPRLHEQRRCEPVGFAAYVPDGRGAGMQSAERLADDLVGLVQHRVPLGNGNPTVRDAHT